MEGQFGKDQNMKQLAVEMETGVDSAQDFNKFVKFFIFLAHIIVIGTLPISFFFCFKAITDDNRAIRYRLGRLQKGQPKKGTQGMFFVLPLIDSFITISVKPRKYAFLAENVKIKDDEMVTVDVEVYHHVTNAMQCHLKKECSVKPTSIGCVGQTALREILRGMKMSDIFCQMANISKVMQDNMNKIMEVIWGIKIDRVDIRDVKAEQKYGIGNGLTEGGVGDNFNRFTVEGQRDLKIMKTLLQSSTPLEY